jgi:hypothetical protein
MAWIVYSNERSTGEARRAVVCSHSPTSLTLPFLWCISTSYSSLTIIVAVTGSCIFVFLAKPSPSLGASRTKRRIGIPTARFRPSAASLPCPALRRLLPHLPPLYTTYAPPIYTTLATSLACCLRLRKTPVTHACIALDSFLLLLFFSTPPGNHAGARG